MSYNRGGPLLVGIVGLLVSAAAGALEPFGATPQETALCSAFVYGGKDRDSNVRSEPGIGWEHAHHWCDCVRFRYRAVRSIGDRDSFRYNSGQALQGCDYVIGAVRPGSRILPKVHVDKGRVLKLRGETRAATQEFQRAISLEPREINAYSELSLLLEEGGQKVAARETVALGLQHNPESKLLQKRYRELGGKEPFPEPISRTAPAPILPQSSVAPAPSDVLELEPPEPVIAVEVQPEAPSDANNQPTDDGKSMAEGSGRSCRFCPPEEIQRRWIESFKADQPKKSE